MNEYICADCRTTFDIPKTWLETHGLDTPPYEKMSCCPNCGGDYELAIMCDNCENIFYDDELTAIYNSNGKDKELFCETCIEKIYSEIDFVSFDKFLKTNKNYSERFYVDWLFSNLDISEKIRIIREKFYNDYNWQKSQPEIHQSCKEAMSEFAKETDGEYLEWYTENERRG